MQKNNQYFCTYVKFKMPKKPLKTPIVLDPQQKKISPAFELTKKRKKNTKTN